MTPFDPFVIQTCEGRLDSKARRRPFRPKPGAPFLPFRMSDPFGVRNAIVPVFCQHTDGRMYGVGTAFCIDEFGSFLTAYHVIDFVEGHLAGRPILFLGMNAVVFGTVNIPEDCFVPAAEVHASKEQVDDPIAAMRGEVRMRPAIDVAQITPEPIGSGAGRPQALPVRKRGWRPTIGEIVLAVGFPELDLSELDIARQTALLTEGMFGVYGRVVAVHPQGRSSTNPSPVFEVEGDWPPGMSGGPVFNRAGEVVGMVSRSVRAEADHPGSGFAVHFALARDVELLTANVDDDNPGWGRCWGVFEPPVADPLLRLPTREAAEAAAAKLGDEADVRQIAHRIGGTEIVEL